MSTISGVSSSGDAWAAMKAQRSQMQAKMFAKVDNDSSGGVDKTELQSLMDEVAKKSGVTNTNSTDQLFSKLDANSDGSLSTDELGKSMKEILPPPSTMDFAQSRSNSTSSNGKDDLFSKVDTDGSLTETEFSAERPQGKGATQGSHGPQGAGGPPPPPPPGGAGGAGGAGASSSTTYDPLDTNQDGTVSAAERLAGSTSTDAVQTLLKAIDTDGDKKISATETDAFLTKLSSQLDTLTQTSQNTTSSTTASSSSTSSNDNVDLVKLVQQAYEQIASGLNQQTKGSTLSAVA